MTETQKEYRTAWRERKKANENELRKSLLSSGTHFLFQTESRTKYTKLQVLSKQVYIGEVDKEYQKSLKAMANHVSTFWHIQQSYSKRILEIDYVSMNTKMR